MNTATLSFSTARRPAARPLSSALAHIPRRLFGFIERRRKARALREMTRLSDHVLRDIGISRLQLDIAMRR
jgi:uncharacterized protein YjiS (DUF1127 family)